MKDKGVSDGMTVAGQNERRKGVAPTPTAERCVLTWATI